MLSDFFLYSNDTKRLCFGERPFNRLLLFIPTVEPKYVKIKMLSLLYLHFLGSENTGNKGKRRFAPHNTYFNFLAKINRYLH
jgi:hypothetical protein